MMQTISCHLKQSLETIELVWESGSSKKQQVGKLVWTGDVLQNFTVVVEHKQ